ncbi:MAG: exo-alpha-sialidase [Gemmatimonadetes bacterium]|nr:exo-alpha-sialidase [Gemmatimonadota bacterium]
MGADMRHSVIYQKEGTYACFPTLGYDFAGALRVRFSTRVLASHIDPRGGHLTLVSQDEGQTWTPGEGEPLNPDWADAAGAITIPAANGWRYAPAVERVALEARSLEVRKVPDGSVAFAEGCVLRRSTDGGLNFVETSLQTPAQALVMNFYDVASMLRYDEHTLMRVVYGRPEPNIPFYEVWLLRSSDDGGTWAWTTLASDPKCQVGLGESSLLRTGDGDVIAMMRAEPVRQHPHLHLSRSSDAGLTWSEPVNTRISGHPPHLLCLRDGRILCSYGFRQERMGIRVVVSDDDGHTWSEPRVLRDDGCGRGGDLGYPVTVQLSDDSLLTVYYFTGADGITHVAGTNWTL